MDAVSLQHYERPTSAELDDFIIRLVFGDGDKLGACVELAYLDLCRTLRGISSHPQRQALSVEAHSNVAASLERLKNLAHDLTQQDFDSWHFVACKSICDLYSARHYDDFHIGQAQKWLNMSLKYIFTLGEVQVEGFDHLFSLAHAPIDGIVLQEMRRLNAPDLPEVWSKIDDYNYYLSLQRWFRSSFQGSAPLAVEFRMW